MSTGSAGGAIERVVFNGVDGETGDYLIPPMDADIAARIAAAIPLTPEQEARLALSLGETMRGVEGVMPDMTDLAQAGWAVLFGRDVSSSIREALAPLLDLRKLQAEGLFKRLEGKHAEAAARNDFDGFMDLCQAPPAPVEPARLPYYVLLVGSPESIPFAFQHQLDLLRACGRVHFATAEEAASYAKAVLASEDGSIRRSRRMDVFAPSNADDPATALSSQHLAAPVAAAIREQWESWQVAEHVAAAATKAKLARIVGGDGQPAIVFTASHGVGMKRGSVDQEAMQGALACQDWVRGTGQKRADYAFAGSDVRDDADVAGSVWLSFACFGAGTPAENDFWSAAPGQEPRLAERPFIGALPTRLLSHPRGGALAFIGHVERAWSYSFRWRKLREDHFTFLQAVNLIAAGVPVGHALSGFGERYASFAIKLTEKLRPRGSDPAPDPMELGGLWTASTDARNFVLLGDPAVRLRVEKA